MNYYLNHIIYENYILLTVDLDCICNNNWWCNVIKNSQSYNGNLNNPSLPNAWWVDFWNPKRLLRRLLRVPNTDPHQVFGGFWMSRVTMSKHPSLQSTLRGWWGLAFRNPHTSSQSLTKGVWKTRKCLCIKIITKLDSWGMTYQESNSPMISF